MNDVHSDHRRHDERSLALHRLIAQRLAANPALLDKARDNVYRWRQLDGAPTQTTAEWATILDGTAERVVRFLADPSETATRPRQSSPFMSILTEQERLAIYEPYSGRTYRRNDSGASWP